MEDSDKICRYAHLNQLSTSQLEEILRADMAQSNNGNTDMILYIMEVIEQRKKGRSKEAIADTNRAWKEFQSVYNTAEGAGQSLYPSEISLAGHAQPAAQKSLLVHSSKNNHHKSYRFGATVAALIIVVLLLTPPAFGYENIYQMLGRWSDQIFHFETSSDVKEAGLGQSEEMRREGASGEYTTLQEALDAYGISDSVVPKQIPEGFELTSIQAVELPSFEAIQFSAYYEKSDAPLTILIISHSNSFVYEYEKDRGPVEEYASNETVYYLFENLGQQVAAWCTGFCECSISGEISRDELKMMVDSISER